MNQDDFGRCAGVRSFVQWAGPLVPPEGLEEGWIHRPLQNPPETGVERESVTGKPVSVQPRLARLANLPITLCNPKSQPQDAKAPTETIFGRLVPDHYQWRAVGLLHQPRYASMVSDGRWAETSMILSRLSADLRSGGVRPLEVPFAGIVAWGGGTSNRNRGAWRQFERYGDSSSLERYLLDCGRGMALACGDAAYPGPVWNMNSMLTKIHALWATDGLPMYDSRVSAAAATLVETWRRDPAGRKRGELPAALRFPQVRGRQYFRSVEARYPDAPTSLGTASYAGKGARTWAGASMRLGWLMQELLGTHCSPGAMRWLEASLFVAGYDPRGINSTPTAWMCASRQGRMSGT